MKRRAIACLFAEMLLIFFMCGCQPTITYQHKNTITIALMDSAKYTAKKTIYTAEKGSDICVSLELLPEYQFESCSYSGEYSVEQEENTIKLTLKDVKYDMRLRISAQKISGKIFYYLNGGDFVDQSKTDDYFTENAVTQWHLRPNTNIGTGYVYRDGYTQLGWNTSPDGTGTHIGLGSRITVEKNSSVNLYAEWVKWAEDSSFEYVLNENTEAEDDVVLTKYKGASSVDSLVIPAKIDGFVVSGLGENFSSRLSAKALVLPNTLLSIAKGAFLHNRIESIYFFDNLTEVYDASFGKRIPKVYINAAIAPRYTTENDNAQFAENMDRLIVNADKKKMVFFAGCSMSYGLISEQVERAFKQEYVICNMGVIGGTNATFQFDCITEYLGEGDVFIHAPEEMSPYQLLHNIKAEHRMFICTESNYDLLSLVDFSETADFFSAFVEYNEIRMGMEERKYTDYNDHYNVYGDYVFARPDSSASAYFDLEKTFAVEYVNERSLARLNAYYGRIADKGANVFVSFAPINRNALSKDDVAKGIDAVFAQKLQEGLETRFKVISKPQKYIIEGRYFYDADYHLTSNGARVRTDEIINDVAKALKELEGDKKV